MLLKQSVIVVLLKFTSSAQSSSTQRVRAVLVLCCTIEHAMASQPVEDVVMIMESDDEGAGQIDLAIEPALL
jgi:hypothetical protein